METVQQPAENRGRDQTSGQVGFLEQVQSDRIDNEEYDESGNTAVGQDHGDDEDDRCSIFALAEAGDPFGNGLRSTGKLIDSTEQSAYEEYQEVARDIR